MNKKVVIYSTPTCHFCHLVKEFFQQNAVTYEEHDVATDFVARQAMVEKTGQMGVPVITIDDEVIIGFDEPALKKALGI